MSPSREVLQMQVGGSSSSTSARRVYHDGPPAGFDTVVEENAVAIREAARLGSWFPKTAGYLNPIQIMTLTLVVLFCTGKFVFENFMIMNYMNMSMCLSEVLSLSYIICDISKNTDFDDKKLVIRLCLELFLGGQREVNECVNLHAVIVYFLKLDFLFQVQVDFAR